MADYFDGPRIRAPQVAMGQESPKTGQGNTGSGGSLARVAGRSDEALDSSGSQKGLRNSKRVKESKRKKGEERQGAEWRSREGDRYGVR